jgi:hypothetical protein
MKRDSFVILLISAALSFGIAGGAYFLYLDGQHDVTPDSENGQMPRPPKNQSKTTTPSTTPASSANNGRSDVPIKCVKPDGSVFWTNAIRCQDADLDNRLSIVDSADYKTKVDSKNSSNSNSRSSSPTRNEQKAFPQTMSIQCKYAIGKARRIEVKSLNLKDDPEESVWKDSYCRWVCEAHAENCGDVGEYLNLVQICPRRGRIDKRTCGTKD